MDNRSETGCGCMLLMVLVVLLLVPFLTVSGAAALILGALLFLGFVFNRVGQNFFRRHPGGEPAPETQEVPASEDVIDVEAHTVEARSAEPQERQ